MSNWIAQYMDMAVDVFREKKKSLGFYYVGYYVLMMIFIFALIFVGAIFVAIGVGVFVSGGIDDSGPNLTFLKVIVILFALIFHTLIQNMKVGIAAIGAIHHTKREIKAAEAVKIAFKRMLKCLGLVALIDLPFFVIGWFATDFFLNEAFLEGLANASRLWFEALGESPLMIGFFVLAILIVFILLSLTFVAYFTWFNFALFSILFERKSIIDSITLSFKRIKYQYWRIYWAAVVINLTYTAMIYAMTGITQGLTLLSQLTLGFAPVVGLFLLQAVSSINMIVTIISAIIGTSIVVIANGELYWQARHLDTADDLIRSVKAHTLTIQSNLITEEV